MGVFDNLKQLGNLKAMRDQAVKIQQSLAAEKIEVVKGNVKVVISGDQKLISLEVDGVSQDPIKDVVNEAVKKSQELAAKKVFELQEQ